MKNIDDLLIELRSQLASCQSQMELLATRAGNITSEIRGGERVRELLALPKPTKLIVMHPDDIAAAQALMASKPPQQRRSKIERAVARMLSQAENKPMTPHQLAEGAGVSAPSMSRCLTRMVERGLLVKSGGRYALTAEKGTK